MEMFGPPLLPRPLLAEVRFTDGGKITDGPSDAGTEQSEDERGGGVLEGVSRTHCLIGLMAPARDV